MEHTKEPWEVNDKRHSGWMDNSVYLYADQHGNFAKLFTDAGADSIANARRIVACVNACAEIPTEDLEESSMTILQYMEDQYAEKLEAMKQHRDLMLKALQTAEELYKVGLLNAKTGQIDHVNKLRQIALATA